MSRHSGEASQRLRSPDEDSRAGPTRADIYALVDAVDVVHVAGRSRTGVSNGGGDP